MDLTKHLPNLYYLVRVVDAGGFAAAAREIGTTRSLLSRHIIELEQALGVRLLFRDARRFAVTATGEKVYQHAALMCDVANAAVAASHDMPGRGRLRVGMSDALLSLMTAMLTDYAASSPHMRLQTTTGNDVGSLLNQRTDIILHHGRELPDSADIVAHPLGQIRLVTVASPEWLQQMAYPQHPTEVAAQHHLCYTGLEWTPQWIARVSGIDLSQARLVSDRLDPVIQSARAGLGLALLPMHVCREDLDRGRLQLACGAFQPLPIPLHGLTLTGYGSGKAPIHFIRFLRDYFGSKQTADLASKNAHASYQARPDSEVRVLQLARTQQYKALATSCRDGG